MEYIKLDHLEITSTGLYIVSSSKCPLKLSEASEEGVLVCAEDNLFPSCKCNNYIEGEVYNHTCRFWDKTVKADGYKSYTACTYNAEKESV